MPVPQMIAIHARLNMVATLAYHGRGAITHLAHKLPDASKPDVPKSIASQGKVSKVKASVLAQSWNDYKLVQYNEKWLNITFVRFAYCSQPSIKKQSSGEANIGCILNIGGHLKMHRVVFSYFIFRTSKNDKT